MSVFTNRQIFTLVVTVLFVGVASVTVQPFRVVGASMEPTYSHDELVLVERVTHRLTISRGDVLVFENPHDTKHVTIKRAIGLPGERVDITPGSVTITAGEEKTVFEEGSLIGGIRNGDAFTMQLGPEDYFVLGDNRSKSSDSRTFGAVQMHNIIGKVILCIWPYSCRLHNKLI